MRFSIRFADKIVGTLVVLALAILVVVVFMLGRNQRWFRYDYQYLSYFNSANGLSINMAVQYKGFTIGHVKNFKLSDDDSVEVLFTIFEEYHDRVREGSVVEIIASPIGLGNSFIFYSGKGATLIDEGGIIPDINSQQGRRFLAEGKVDRPETAGDNINNLMNQVSELLDTINISLAGSAGAEDLSLGQILLNIEKAAAGLADPDGTIMRILDGDGPVYNDLTAIINSLSGILEDVNRTTDVLPAQLPIILNNLNTTLIDLQDVLTAAANNPLLRGGVPQRTETGPGGAGSRNLEF